MRLWTLQPEWVYEKLKKDGVFVCDPTKSTMLQFYCFEKAYRWITNQMIRQIGPPPAGVSFPIWAWHTTYWKHRKPDLRRTEFRSFSEPMLCIEIEKPDNEVLLSDEENWHFVLNDSYISDNEQDDNAFDFLPEQQKEHLKEISWKKIFDISPYEDNRIRKGMFVQATFWVLKFEETIKATIINKKH